MKIFGGEVITKMFDRLGADEDMPITAKPISHAVENAQKKVESRNFTTRKNVLKYDDVMNVQREVIYGQRRQVLDGEDLHESILGMIDSVAENVVLSYYEQDEKGKATLDVEALTTEILNIFAIDMTNFIKDNTNDSAKVIEELKKLAHEKYIEKEGEIGEEIRELERVVMLKVVDQKWMDHIDNMEELKDGIGLRAYGQKDPVQQYRQEGSEMFDDMIADIQTDVVKILMNIRKQKEVRREETAKITGAALQAINSVDSGKTIKDTEANKTVINEEPKIGRNDPCPCGSGLKYKNCHGKNA